MDEEIIREIEGKEILHWNFRGFADLPIELKTHGALVQELYLKWNNLKSLPTWITNIKNLTNLYLFGNGLEYLPDEIGQLQFLTTLDLQNNKLQGLPNALTNLKNLNYLDLQFNSITILPTDIGNLKALYFLNLKGNNIQYLPPSICNLHSLQELNLDCNQIKCLPQNIVYLPNLSYISVNGNDLNYVPSVWFLSNPLFCFSHNPRLNYLPYEVGCALTRNCDIVIEGPLWHINISGCCEGGVKDDFELQFRLRIFVPQKQQYIIFPPPMKLAASEKSKFIPSLHELTLRKMYCILFSISEIRQCTFNEILEQMPQETQSTLWLGPTCLCYMCRSPIFTECVLWIISRYMLDDANGHMPNQILSTIYFCSKNCSFLFRKREIIYEDIYEKLSSQMVDWVQCS